MNRIFVALTATAGVLLLSVAVYAHHSTALYTADKQVTLKGTVTQWVWTNPHCFLKFDVTGEDGSVQHWAVETQNPTDMTARGFARTSFRAGDVVTLTVQPARSGAPAGLLVTALLPNGQTLHAVVAAAAPKP
jgi:hypothetical protein